MPVAVDSTNNIVRSISKKAILSKERILNTDGKTTFLGLTDKITLKSEKYSMMKKIIDCIGLVY